MNSPFDIVNSIIITEKATELADAYDKYSFKVSPRATKPQIKRAVEEIFDVTVASVNVLNQRGKRKRMGRPMYGKRPDWKKAVVTLSEGEIELI